MGSSDVSACLDEELLAAFVSGGLDATEIARVDAHLARCEDCLLAVGFAAGPPAAGGSELASDALKHVFTWERLLTQGPGVILSGRFEVGEFLAQGGMGAVYRGVDRETHLPVAIKLLKPEVVAESPELLVRFRRESEILRQLDHPNIVKMIDASLDRSLPYIVMEYVAGGSLRDLLRRQPQLPIARALSIALELVDALARAHHLRAIHRDIKPENVLLAVDGTPRLTDFGLARMGEQAITRVDALVGTLAYLSPEALSGQSLDHRADIWAFGVMLFEMLAGHRPFRGEHQGALVTAILQSRPTDLESLRPDAPVALVDLVHRMLEKDRDLRVPGTRQIGAELEAILKGIPGVGPLGQVSRKPGVERPGHAATPGPRRTSDNLPAPLATFLGR
ncbi:MAG: protein kinase, partial [Deltaproteobacteria bacterium]